MIQRFDIDGNPNLGVSILAKDNIAIVSPGLQESYVKTIEETLDVPIIKAPICGSNLAGALIAGNTNSLLVSQYIFSHELDIIRKHDVNIEVIPDQLTAIGNVVVANDNGAIVNPNLSSEAKEIIKNSLDVEVVSTTIAGLDIVGSAVAATNKGALVHPDASEEELDLIEDVLGVPAEIGTVNRGVKLVGACLIANSNGVIVGNKTTGPELARIDQVFNLFEGSL
ncbi:MAG: translation initiation factor IF-6 [Methanosphaera sp.]|uniref:translation initiation factor IF-6 n=1 Tax=Methanosphaera sp. TaxID=2666342 RepID=UPI0025D14937|nr:translation initiation factor IF-6 [Methanosphaera sp.]MCI5867865.1 translation initiation factor IF-6 [Methanosphaera sp.]MDD6534875.1 translation initiation factor IF-6 [Methanosphaera sp.]MDY3955335.1 translation initiation factor IF-6 [Methanosphaera sp.]